MRCALAILALVACVFAASQEQIRRDLSGSHAWAVGKHQSYASSMQAQVNELLAAKAHAQTLSITKDVMARLEARQGMHTRDEASCQAGMQTLAQQAQQSACPLDQLATFFDFDTKTTTPQQQQANTATFCTACVPVLNNLLTGLLTYCADQFNGQEDGASITQIIGTLNSLTQLMCLQTATDPKQYCFPIVISSLTSLGDWTNDSATIDTTTLNSACATGCMQRFFAAAANLPGASGSADGFQAAVFLCLRDEHPYTGAATYCISELQKISKMADNPNNGFPALFTEICNTRCVQKYNALSTVGFNNDWQPACHRDAQGVPCAVNFYNYVNTLTVSPNEACASDWSYQDLPRATSTCGATCAASMRNLTAAMGCCTTEFINLVSLDTVDVAAAKVWMEGTCMVNYPDNCATYTNTSLSLTVYGLSSDYCTAAANVAQCKAAVRHDIAQSLGLPDSYLSDVTLNAPTARRRLLAPNTVVSYVASADSTNGALSVQADQQSAQTNGFMLSSTGALPAGAKSDPLGQMGSSPLPTANPAPPPPPSSAGHVVPSLLVALVALLVALF